MVGVMPCWPLPTQKERMMTKDDVNTIEMDCELTLEELEIVSGGLNPQPLPPRWGEPGIRFLNPQPLPPG
jgi:hypothetical protein